MEVRDVECIVAAILTAASIDSTGAAPMHAVNRYTQILQMLRDAGGPVEPRALTSSRR
jgi:hypothetical protein